MNITMPTTGGARGIEWTDLDLDYRVHLDHSVEQLDREEFAQNVHRMGYTPALIEQVEITCREVEAGLASRSYPFDYERQVELSHPIQADRPGG